MYKFIAVLYVFLSCSVMAVRSGAQAIPLQRVTDIRHFITSGDTLMEQKRIHFTYSGNRESNFSVESLISNSFVTGKAVHYGYQYIYTSDDVVRWPEPQGSIAGKRQLGVYFDSAVVYENQSGVLLPAKRYAVQYPSDTAADYRFLDINTGKVYISPLTGSKENSQIIYYGYDSTSNPDTTFKRIININEKGLPETDTQFAYNSATPVTVNNYEYDAYNQLILQHTLHVYQGGQLDNEHTHYQYDIHHNLTRIVWLKEIGMGVLDTLAVSEMRYDNQQRLTDYYSFGSWWNRHTDYHHSLHYNAAGDADTIMHEITRPSKILKAYNVIHYNESHLPDTALWYLHTVPQDKTFVYYTYEKDDIPDTPAMQSSPLIIYPNPAQHIFTIRWNGQQPATPVYIAMYNTAGQLVRSSFIEKTLTENTVDIRGLSSGVYYLDIRTYSGGQLYSGGLTVNQ